MQNEIVKAQRLLNENGGLSVCGWAKEPLLQYDKDDVKAPRRRLKEWESYFIISSSCALQLSIADHGYVGLISATLIDFKRMLQHTKTIKKPLPMGRMNMPATSKHGDVTYTEKQVGMNFSKAAAKHYIKSELINFIDVKNLYVNLELEESDARTLVTAFPFSEDQRCFHYGQKTIYPHLKGIVRCGGDEYPFENGRSFGLLNWGRSVWPSHLHWSSACGCGSIQGHSFSLYLSDGPGSSSAISESAFFFDGQLYKLERLHFKVPENPQQRWKIFSEDRQLGLLFEPAFDYHKEISVGLGASKSTLYFGLFSGQVTLKNGSILPISNLVGFIEQTDNQKW